MKRIAARFLIIPGWAVTVERAVAHPGHGEPGPAHYLVEPEHAGGLLLAVCTAALVAGAIALVWKPVKSKYFD